MGLATKTVEWKDTKFQWVNEQAYSLFTRNRYVFCYGTGKTYVKSINYAQNFTRPNNIVVLFVFGAPKNMDTLRRKVSESNHQFLVIQVPVDNDVIAAQEEYESLQTHWKKAGLSAEYFAEHADNPIYQADLDKAKAGEANLAILHEQQHRTATAFANFMPEQEIETDFETFLLATAKRVYPKGIEVTAPCEASAKQIGFKKMLNQLVTGKKSPVTTERYGDNNEAADAVVEEIHRFMLAELDRDGYVKMDAVWQKLVHPPYGLYKCCFSDFQKAKIMYRFASPQYFVSDGVSDWPSDTQGLETWLTFVGGVLFQENEIVSELKQSLFKIFDVQAFLEAHPTYFNGKRMSLHLVLSVVRTIIQDVWELQEPLSVTDQRWEPLLGLSKDSDGMLLTCIWSWCKQFRDWIFGHEDELYQAVRRTHETVYQQVAETYGDTAKLDLFYKFRHVKGGAVGWVWPAKTFYEWIDAYMPLEVCRECGQPLVNSDMKNLFVYSDWDTGGLIKFTLKQIQGLNKKFLGRYQNEYFCIPCLAEILDTTPMGLYEKMHDFQEQGCELFG